MRHDAGGRLLLYGVRVNGVLIIDMHLSYFSPLDLVNILASVVKNKRVWHVPIQL